MLWFHSGARRGTCLAKDRERDRTQRSMRKEGRNENSLVVTEAMKKNWFPVACLLILTAAPMFGSDEPRSKAAPTSSNPATSSLDDWLCANVSPLFCPGIPDLRDRQLTPRQPPQRVRNAQTSPKDLKERAQGPR